MGDEGWGEERRSKREIKRASVENGCLFEEGLILMGQGDASAVLEAAIHKGRGNMEEEEYMKERDAAEGKDREGCCCFKNIWEPSGSGEKNAGLS